MPEWLPLVRQHVCSTQLQDEAISHAHSEAFLKPVYPSTSLLLQQCLRYLPLPSSVISHCASLSSSLEMHSSFSLLPLPYHNESQLPYHSRLPSQLVPLRISVDQYFLFLFECCLLLPSHFPIELSVNCVAL